MPDYALLDQPLLLNCLFFPRSDFTPPPPDSFDLMVPVEENAQVACRFYPGEADWPWLLYFHGNGEVAADYDEISQIYKNIGINLTVADYRGYGASTGTPNFSRLIKDAHAVFKAVNEEIINRGFGTLQWIMGRSLGSISALELAFQHQARLKGVIIESGFACASRLIKQWGVPADYHQLEQVENQCLDMIGKTQIPVLVIHGQDDNLVYPREGKLIFDLWGSPEKQLVIIPGADHNDIMFADPQKYFQSLKIFIRLE